MAEEHIKSTPITNADATPKVANNPGVSNGFIRRAVGIAEAASSASVGSTYRFCRVPSNAHIHKLTIAGDDQGATGQVNVGVYKTADDGGAVVDADHFASAVDFGAGAVAETDITHEAGVYNIAEAEQPLWEALGLSADPGIDYDIVATCSEIMADGGTLMLKVEYV